MSVPWGSSAWLERAVRLVCAAAPAQGAGLGAFLVTVEGTMAAGGRTARPAGEMSWEEFERKFGHLLAWLEIDQWVVASASGRPGVYVQIKLIEGGLRMETTSNTYLMGADRLTEEQESRLLALGWRAPSDARDGSPNFYLDLPWPIDASAVARRTARTLAEIHRVVSPASVVLEAQDPGSRPVPAVLAIAAFAAFDLRLAGRVGPAN